MCSKPMLNGYEKNLIHIFMENIYAREGLAQSRRTINQSQKYIYGT